MVLTQAQKKAALKHVLATVLDQDESTSPLSIALKEESITNIGDLLVLSADDVDGLTYPVANDTGRVSKKPVPKGLRNLLLVFIDYVQHRIDEGDPIHEGWAQVTNEQFDTFRTDLTYQGRLSPAKTLPLELEAQPQVPLLLPLLLHQGPAPPMPWMRSRRESSVIRLHSLL